MRIGQGYDVHRLVEGRELWLCGIKLEHTLGLLGHSDADVAIHALCDAILGALALRDIGYHFPDTDPRYKGADSKLLLAEVCRMMTDKGYAIGNVDITICAERPKINPHIEKMRENSPIYSDARSATSPSKRLRPKNSVSPAARRVSPLTQRFCSGAATTDIQINPRSP